MKTIIRILLIIFLSFNFYCGGSDTDTNNDDNTVIITNPDVDNPVEVVGPTPPAEFGTVKIALYTSESIKFYDGNTIWEWKTGNIKKATNRIYTSGNVIYKLDERGETIASRNLIIEPDAIAINPEYITSRGEIQEEINLGESDIWIIEHILPQEAYDLGALYKDYTKIYLNSVEQGNWFDNQYFCEKIVVLNNDIWGQITTGAWKHLNGSKTNIRIVVENGFAIWDYNSSAHTAIIDNIAVSWTTNFLNGANHWLKSGNTWYSQNGYTWDGTTLVEDGSTMLNWRMRPYDTGYSEGVVIIPAGTRYENGEDVLYWIECNSGHVIRYVPSVDQYQLSIRLYTGDGYRSTGLALQQTLSPVIADDYLYFIYDANTYRYSFITGLTSHFTEGVSEVWEF
jgi:hypothetical protein